MAKFLNTSGVSYHLEELIKNTEDRLILISPYLQLADRIKEHLDNLNIQKKDIRIIYRENKLHVDENNWLESQIGIRTSICKNLHSKCYINENEAIVTSMNLYEFSQQNNNEMGIYVTKDEDPKLYDEIFIEVQRLLKISDEIRVSVKMVEKNDISKSGKGSGNLNPKQTSKSNKSAGYCIRTGKEIPFNIKKPFSAEAFKAWNKYQNPDFQEKFCHFSGEPSNGDTTFKKPILNKNYKKATEVHSM